MVLDWHSGCLPCKVRKLAMSKLTDSCTHRVSTLTFIIVEVASLVSETCGNMIGIGELLLIPIIRMWNLDDEPLHAKYVSPPRVYITKCPSLTSARRSFIVSMTMGVAVRTGVSFLVHMFFVVDINHAYKLHMNM